MNELQKHYTNEQTGISYTLVGDYYLPDLAMPKEETEIHLSPLGMRHKDYLKNNRKPTYSSLMISGKLMQHCKEVQDQANNMLEYLVKGMAKEQGVTEQLKADDQMAWVGKMENIRSCAMEIVNKELIYVY